MVRLGLLVIRKRAVTVSGTVSVAVAVSVSVLFSVSTAVPFTVLVGSTSHAAISGNLTRVTGAQLKEKLSGAPVTVVNFWATWCEPCKEEFPAILKTKSKFDGQGVRFLLVSMDYDSQEKAIKDFLKGKKVGFETFWRIGNEMEFINSLLPDWSGALPTTAFFNSQGKLIKMVQAKVDQKSLTEQIKKTMALSDSPETIAPNKDVAPTTDMKEKKQ